MSENKICLRLLSLSLAPQQGVTRRYIAKNRPLTWHNVLLARHRRSRVFSAIEFSDTTGVQCGKQKPDAGGQWKAFLNTHREVITAMDFFTVPTMTFDILYCFFVIAHDRRRILHFHVTRVPNSSWIAQQLREAFPYEHRYKYLIFDRDAKFGNKVLSAVESIELASVRTSFTIPWQNGVAERWVGSCRRDLVDHVIALNEPMSVICGDFFPNTYALP